MIRLGCCNRDGALDGGELIGVDETRVCEVTSINTLIEVSNEVLDARLAKVPDFPWELPRQRAFVINLPWRQSNTRQRQASSLHTPPLTP